MEGHQWKVPEERPWFRKGIWPERVPKSLGYSEEPLFSLLERSAERTPDKPSLIFFGKKITFRELNEATNRFANALLAMGLKKGDRVCLLLPNCPQFVIAYFGALKAGGVVVALNPLQTEREIEYEIKDSGAETAVTLNMRLTLPKILSVREKTGLKRIIVSSLKEYLPFPLSLFFNLAMRKELVKMPKEGGGIFHFRRLLREYPPIKPGVEVKGEDLALIQYTGGTTGLPKGCMLTHFNLLANARQVGAYSVQFFPEDRFEPLPKHYQEFLPAEQVERYITGKEMGPVLGVLPLFHVYGMTVIMNTSIAGGMPIILFPRADLERILKAIRRYKPETFPSITTLAVALMEHPKAKECDFTSIRVTGFGAMSTPPHLKEKWSKLTGGFSIEGYGLSEASPVTHMMPAHLKDLSSFGIPLPDTDAKVVDLETGEDLPPGKEGELCVRGPQVMKGYWNRPEETAEALKDGWLHTGDVVKMGENGLFYFVEREKDLIKYKGYLISPAEIENVIYEHPAVALCAVVGKPDEVAGEIPKAFVVLKEEYKGKVTEKEIIDFCSQRLALYKKVREVEFREDLPKSLVGKVLRRVLREEEKAAAEGRKK
ncbi:MAG: long-chain fatty acid--CoA ligase [Hadesarchaea archaeon]|nr:MAG: long-chain fatty acid--CoA ligase [Hadesarchaea archaeon]TDA35796.1 MAG: long-chain fatty acid--CoA ligase [Hadesarchaea archaeon]